MGPGFSLMSSDDGPYNKEDDGSLVSRHTNIISLASAIAIAI